MRKVQNNILFRIYNVIIIHKIFENALHQNQFLKCWLKNIFLWDVSIQKVFSNFLCSGFFIFIKVLFLFKENENCNGTIRYDDVCYFLFRVNRELTVNEMDRECKNRNMTLTDFPTHSPYTIYKFFLNAHKSLIQDHQPLVFYFCKKKFTFF